LTVKTRVSASSSAVTPSAPLCGAGEHGRRLNDRDQKNILRSGAAPLLVGFLILACMIGAVLRFVASEQNNTQAIRHSMEVERELVGMLSILTDAETGQRGYLLTGDGVYLEPYRSALGRVEMQFDMLGAMLAANPAQTHALDDGALRRRSSTSSG
jgi:CHASE3 domain sensor protein